MCSVGRCKDRLGVYAFIQTVLEFFVDSLWYVLCRYRYFWSTPIVIPITDIDTAMTVATNRFLAVRVWMLMPMPMLLPLLMPVQTPICDTDRIFANSVDTATVRC